MSGTRLVGLVVAFVVGFLFLFVVREALAHASDLGYEPGVLHARITGPHTASLTLSTWPDSMQCHGPNSSPGGGPHSDWVSYCPSTSLQVPANSTITVTIKNYDAGDTVKNPFFDRVQGTIGGIELVNGKPTHGFKSQDDVAHTFTMQSIPNSPAQLFISAPMAPVKGGDNAPTPLTLNGSQYPRPMVMTFKFYSGRPGKYIWKCYVPCGSGLEDFQEGFGGPMSTTGYMAGTLTVG